MDRIGAMGSWAEAAYLLAPGDPVVTVIRFTTGWKAMYGLPDDRMGEWAAYQSACRTTPSAEIACRDLIVRERLAPGPDIGTVMDLDMRLGGDGLS